jgi:hypothetical protein
MQVDVIGHTTICPGEVQPDDSATLPAVCGRPVTRRRVLWCCNGTVLLSSQCRCWTAMPEALMEFLGGGDQVEAFVEGAAMESHLIKQ